MKTIESSLMKSKILCLLLLVTEYMFSFCSPVKIYTGSVSTSSESFFIAHLVAKYLTVSHENIYKVYPDHIDNALYKLKGAKQDGSEIMIFNDMTYLASDLGIYSNSYDLSNYKVGPRIAQSDYCCWVSHKTTRYTDLVEVCEYLRENPAAVVRMVGEDGDVSQVAFTVFYQWVDRVYGRSIAKRIYYINGGATSKRIAMLYTDEADIVFADYSAVKPYLNTTVNKDCLKIITTVADIADTDYPSYKSLCITTTFGTSFTYSNDFIVYYPKDLNEDIVDLYDEVFMKMCKDPVFCKGLDELKCKAAYLKSRESESHVQLKRSETRELMKTLPDIKILKVNSIVPH